MGEAFQANAFQNSAFQTAVVLLTLAIAVSSGSAASRSQVSSSASMVAQNVGTRSISGTAASVALAPSRSATVSITPSE